MEVLEDGLSHSVPKLIVFRHLVASANAIEILVALSGFGL